jgi:serine protease Do
MFALHRHCQPPFRFRSLTSFCALLTLAACLDEQPSVSEELRAATVFINVQGTSRPVGEAQTTGNWFGSGFLVSSDGYIVTNNHVAGASVIRQVTIDGIAAPLPAELKGISECSDLAVIKVTSSEKLASLAWSNKAVALSDKVTAAGFPAVTNAAYTVTSGIVSTAPRPESTAWASVDMAFYHDAQINSGNSGGPLVNASTGEVVGVNYAGNSAQNANIAISASEARSVVEILKTGVNVNSIGITPRALVLEQNGTRVPAGIWVEGVRPGDLADQIKIRPGDLIVEFGGLDLQGAGEERNFTLANYCAVLRNNNPQAGATIPVKIMRPDAGNIICEGQINGRTLQAVATNGQTTDCPIDTADPGSDNQDDGDDDDDDNGDPQIPEVNEVEPNETDASAQQLTLPVIVHASIGEGDTAVGIEEDPNFAEDVYVFSTAAGQITVLTASANNADIDVYLFSLAGETSLVGSGQTLNSGEETISANITAGQYAIFVDARPGVATGTLYNLGVGLE